MIKNIYFAFLIFCAFLFCSCSFLLNNQSDDTASLSFAISGELVEKIKTTATFSSRAINADGDGLFLDIELKGDYQNVKQIALSGGKIVVFEDVPVGAVVKAEGIAYSVLGDEKQILYNGETDEISIAEGENALSLVLLRYEEQNPIGKKERPDSLGDIVFSDGSATAYSESLELSDEQKEAAIAVIFYAGSSGDRLGKRLLGIGLHESGSKLAWTTDSAEGYSKISSIICTPTDSSGKSGNESSISENVSFDGESNGSSNWEKICEAVSDENTAGNYPAWEWVNAYGTTYCEKTAFEKGWYMPTVAECYAFRKAQTTINTVLAKIGSFSFEKEYWTSSQVSGESENAFSIGTQSDDTFRSSKKHWNGYMNVFAIREF